MAKDNIHYDQLYSLEIYQSSQADYNYYIKLVSKTEKNSCSYSFWYEDYRFLLGSGLSAKEFKTRKGVNKRALSIAKVALSKSIYSNISIQNFGMSTLDFGCQ